MAAFTAVGSSYATHGQPMIPIYVFYSMFGFQRTGDSIWAAADQMTRGFLIGATAGRTTLTGEGLQHADGHSPLLASTNPAVVHYDPAFSYEIAHIMQDGLHRMYGTDDSLTDDRAQRHLLPHRLQRADGAAGRARGRRPRGHPARALPLRRGLRPRACPATRRGCSCSRRVSAWPWALEAQELLRNDWNVVADVWSVTSWNELRRDGLRCDEAAFLHPEAEAPVPWVTQQLSGRAGSGRGRVRLHAGRPGPDPRSGCRATSPRSAPTGSASPTPARPPAASSTSTARRWRCGRCSRSPSAARSTARCRSRRPGATGCPTSRPAPRATRAATAARCLAARPGRE